MEAISSPLSLLIIYLVHFISQGALRASTFTFLLFWISLYCESFSVLNHWNFSRILMHGFSMTSCPLQCKANVSFLNGDNRKRIWKYLELTKKKKTKLLIYCDFLLLWGSSTFMITLYLNYLKSGQMTMWFATIIIKLMTVKR